MAQSTSDRDVTLRREEIMQARHLWENTASEEVLGELFALNSKSNSVFEFGQIILLKVD